MCLDGGLAGELVARGHDLSGALWSGGILRDDPGAVRDVHAAYLDAGAEIVTSASYQVSREGVIEIGGTAAQADELLRRSVDLAREAVAAAGRGLVAASVGPYGAVRHDGSEYAGRYGLERQWLLDFHRARLDVLVAAGPDLLAVETIPDAEEAEVVVEALADHPDLPAWISFSCADGARVCGGQPIEEAVAVASSAASVIAVGVNCTAPRHVESLLLRARPATRLPLVAYPNTDREWDPKAREWVGQAADGFAPGVVESWLAAGAGLVGGCCGIGPAGIRDVAQTLRDSSSSAR